MKGPFSIILSHGASGLKVEKVCLSAGEARAVFDEIAHGPNSDTTELFLFDRMRPTKSRRFTTRSVDTAGGDWKSTPVAVTPKPKILRRGR